MSGDSSEEKSLPPSAKKLRDARRRGQLAKAPEMVSALAMLGMAGYVWGGSGWIEDRPRARTKPPRHPSTPPIIRLCSL